MSATPTDEKTDRSARESPVESGEKQAQGGDRAADSSDEEKAADKPAPAAGPPPLNLPAEAYLTIAGGWIALFCSFGFLNAFGVFESYYSTSNVIPPTSSSTIAWIGSMQAFLIFASNVVTGPLQDKYGPKPLMLTFAILLSFSCMMISLCHEWYQLFLAQGILQGFALSLGFAPPMACAVAWFKHKAPIAVAIVVSGSSIGGVVWPIVTNALLDHVGFGWTWRAIGFIELGLLLIATTLVSQPNLFAVLPDPKNQDDKVVIKKRSLLARLFIQPPSSRPPPRPFFYWEAFKIPAFNSYLISFFFVYLGLFYTFFFLPSWGVLYGLSQSLSFYSLSILNAASFFGRLGLPFLSFSLGPFNILVLCAIISTIIVFSSLAVTSSAGVLIIGGFYGFWSGGLISMLAPCVASLVKDRTRIGSAVGQLAATTSISALIGTPICGWIIAAPSSPFKGYNGAQGFSAACLTVGTIGLFITKLLVNRNPLGKA